MLPPPRHRHSSPEPASQLIQGSSSPHLMGVPAHSPSTHCTHAPVDRPRLSSLSNVPRKYSILTQLHTLPGQTPAMLSWTAPRLSATSQSVSPPWPFSQPLFSVLSSPRPPSIVSQTRCPPIRCLTPAHPLTHLLPLTPRYCLLCRLPSYPPACLAA